MSWDIYGAPLRRGHCEVHPDVPDPWPCFACVAQAQEAAHYEEERKRLYREMEAAHYAEWAGNAMTGLGLCDDDPAQVVEAWAHCAWALGGTHR